MTTVTTVTTNRDLDCAGFSDHALAWFREGEALAQESSRPSPADARGRGGRGGKLAWFALTLAALAAGPLAWLVM